MENNKMHFHAVVWIDHRIAKILGFGSGDPTCKVVESHGPHHIHHKAGEIGSGHLHDAPEYFEAVANALTGFREILIVGPAETKIEFKNVLDQKPELAARVIGIKAMEHASDAEIVAFARSFFASADRMTPQR
jgi:hypothetical protein